MTRISKELSEQLFTEARSQNGWSNKPVGDAILTELYDLMKFGPTSMNCSPARIVFLRSAEAKSRLAAAVSPGNVDKVNSAPVCAIIGYDTQFFGQLPYLFPHNPNASNLFKDNEVLSEATAFRNSSLQGAYLMIAARALELDCGPMSGFDATKVNQEFFPDGVVKANFVCGLGYGDSAKLFPRNPRLTFEQACSLL